MLDPIYESEEAFKKAVPEAKQDMYTKTPENQYHFSGVTNHGVENIKKLESTVEATRKERDDFKNQFNTTKTELGTWTAMGISIDEAKKRVEGYDALAAGGKPDAEAFNKAVEAKVALTEAKWNQERETLQKERDEFKTNWEKAETSVKGANINTATEAAIEKFNPKQDSRELIRTMFKSAFEVDSQNDIVGKEGFGFTGMNPEQAMEKLKTEHSYLWGEDSKVTPASSKSATNAKFSPWSFEGWSAEGQQKFEAEHGNEAARQEAKQQGSFYGANEPPKPKT